MNLANQSDPDNPTTLVTFLNEVEAASLVAELAESGIQGMTTGSFTTGFRTETPGDISVVVRQSDLVKALEILAQREDGKFEVDWSNVDVGEPEA